MLQVAGIDHVVLRVRDADAAIAFYSSVLGCPIERRNDVIGLIHLRAGDSLIDLVPLGGKLGAAGGAGPGLEGRNRRPRLPTAQGLRCRCDHGASRRA